MARYRFSKADRVLGGKIAGRATFENKTGIHAIPPDEHLENCRRGGLTQGPIQGRRMVASGEWDRIRNLPQTKIAQSEVGKKWGRINGLKRGPLVDWSKVKTPESLKRGADVGGPRGRCKRWHQNRGIWNFKCPICLAAIERGENWGISVYEPED